MVTVCGLPQPANDRRLYGETEAGGGVLPGRLYHHDNATSAVALRPCYDHYRTGSSHECVYRLSHDTHTRVRNGGIQVREGHDLVDHRLFDFSKSFKF